MPDLSDKVSDIAPCPMCGASAKKIGPDPRGLIYCKCVDCGVRGPWLYMGHGGTSEDAIAAWNRRTRSPASSMEGWRTMDSAPKDGTWIDAWRDPVTDPGVFRRSRVTVRWWKFEDGEEAWVWPDDEYEALTVAGREAAVAMIASGDCYEDAKSFTRWQPLPASPIPPEVMK